MKKARKRYSVIEVCVILRINRQTLIKRINDGVVPDRRDPDNGYRVFFKEDIEALRKRLEGEHG